MRKLLILLALVISTSAFGKVVDEGMWLPLLLKKYNYEQMKQMGLKLSPEDIYSPDKPSLNDAVMSFGGFCTGEIVSKEGLVLTNHHCGYGSIQSHSTPEHDYLTKGFWAMNKKEELSNPDLFVNILKRMEDVTNEMLDAIGDKEGAEKRKAIEEKVKELTEQAVEGTHYHADIESMFNGLEYYLFVYEKFTDIRLVGTPPSSIGKYGGDTDNWMWPRHTGDFSVFRIYAGADNKPAEYSPENKPYTPEHYLPVSIKGIEQGSFAMTYGYPGRTDRYITSYGLQLTIETVNPVTVAVTGAQREAMRKGMEASDEVRIKLAADYASLSNGWKYNIGQNKFLKEQGVLAVKKKEEAAFMQWVNADPKRKEKYGSLLSEIGQLSGNLKDLTADNICNLRVLIGPQTSKNALKFRGMASFATTKKPKDAPKQTKEEIKAAEEAKEKAVKGMAESLLAGLDDMYKNYDAETDKQVWIAIMNVYVQIVGKDRMSPVIAEIHEKKSFEKYFDKAFKKSFFADKEKMREFLNEPDADKLMEDPIYRVFNAAWMSYLTIARDKKGPIDAAIAEKTKLLIQGMREMQPERKFYPDANFTLRLSYGDVQPYNPADGVTYNILTTLDGVMAKEDPTNPEFVVEPKLKELYNNKDYGKYGVNGVMPVCFLTDNDITGGNSGSPVINGEGHLIGLAFDGNWESMPGDLVYDAPVNRCINVDIRYVLFIIDKFAGAGHLVEEMTVIE